MGWNNLDWVSDGNRNDWSRYVSRVGEASNNIHPQHNIWRYARVKRNYTGRIADEYHLDNFESE